MREIKLSNLLKLLIVSILLSACSENLNGDSANKNVITNNNIKNNTSKMKIDSITKMKLDDMIIEFERQRILSTNRFTIREVSINFKKDFLNGWTGYILDLKLNANGKEVNTKDILFTDGKIVSPEILNMDTTLSMRNDLSPEIPNSYYKDSKIIAGNKNAVNKLVVFSDPLCPFCTSYMPKIIKFVNDNPDNIALYYYHFPLLNIHPAAKTISLAMSVLENKSVKIDNLALKIYQADFKKHFEATELDEAKILKGFNAELKTNVTLDEINEKNIHIDLKDDAKKAEDMLVGGTPTIFVNGKLDNTRELYKTLK